MEGSAYARRGEGLGGGEEEEVVNSSVNSSAGLGDAKKRSALFVGEDLVAAKVREMIADPSNRDNGLRNPTQNVFPVFLYNHYQLLRRFGGDYERAAAALKGAGRYQEHTMQDAFFSSTASSSGNGGSDGQPSNNNNKNPKYGNKYGRDTLYTALVSAAPLQCGGAVHNNNAYHHADSNANDENGKKDNNDGAKENAHHKAVLKALRLQTVPQAPPPPPPRVTTRASPSSVVSAGVTPHQQQQQQKENDEPKKMKVPLYHRETLFSHLLGLANRAHALDNNNNNNSAITSTADASASASAASGGTDASDAYLSDPHSERRALLDEVIATVRGVYWGGNPYHRNGAASLPTRFFTSRRFNKDEEDKREYEESKESDTFHAPDVETNTNGNKKKGKKGSNKKNDDKNKKSKNGKKARKTDSLALASNPFLFVPKHRPHTFLLASGGKRESSSAGDENIRRIDLFDRVPLYLNRLAVPQKLSKSTTMRNNNQQQQSVLLPLPFRMDFPRRPLTVHRTRNMRGSYDHWLLPYLDSIAGHASPLVGTARYYFGMMMSGNGVGAGSGHYATYRDVIGRRGKVLFITINDDMAPGEGNGNSNGGGEKRQEFSPEWWRSMRRSLLWWGAEADNAQTKTPVASIIVEKEEKQQKPIVPIALDDDTDNSNNNIDIKSEKNANNEKGNGAAATTAGLEGKTIITTPSSFGNNSNAISDRPTWRRPAMRWAGEGSAPLFTEQQQQPRHHQVHSPPAAAAEAAIVAIDTNNDANNNNAVWMAAARHAQESAVKRAKAHASYANTEATAEQLMALVADGDASSNPFSSSEGTPNNKNIRTPSTLFEGGLSAASTALLVARMPPAVSSAFLRSKASSAMLSDGGNSAAATTTNVFVGILRAFCFAEVRRREAAVLEESVRSNLAFISGGAVGADHQQQQQQFAPQAYARRAGAAPHGAEELVAIYKAFAPEPPAPWEA